MLYSISSIGITELMDSRILLTASICLWENINIPFILMVCHLLELVLLGIFELGIANLFLFVSTRNLPCSIILRSSSMGICKDVVLYLGQYIQSQPISFNRPYFAFSTTFCFLPQHSKLPDETPLDSGSDFELQFLQSAPEPFLHLNYKQTNRCCGIGRNANISLQSFV